MKLLRAKRFGSVSGRKNKMRKKVYIIHGWSEYPEEGWFPWLKKEIEGMSYEVHAPFMPNTDEPKIEEWVPFLENLVTDPNEQTYFIGHSIGCQTILRYIKNLPEKLNIGGVIMVAPWIFLKDLSSEEEWKIAAPWIPETLLRWGKPLLEKEWGIAQQWCDKNFDFVKVRTHTSKFVAIFSDDDPFVPLGNSDIFKECLGADVILKEKMGHFSVEDEVFELPVVLEEFRKMTA